MTDNFKKFTKIISENKDLQEKIKLLGDNEAKIKDFIISEAKNHGITITNEDFNQSSQELSKEEMAQINGAGACACVIAGGGGGDGLGCACFKSGMGVVEKSTAATSQGGCYCIGIGAGATRRH